MSFETDCALIRKRALQEEKPVTWLVEQLVYRWKQPSMTPIGAFDFGTPKTKSGSSKSKTTPSKKPSSAKPKDTGSSTSSTSSECE